MGGISPFTRFNVVYSSPSLLKEMASGQRNSEGLYTVAYMPSLNRCPQILALLFTKPSARNTGSAQLWPPSSLTDVKACFHRQARRPSGSV